MPTDQPNSAPEGEKPALRDDLNAAAVLHDEDMDKTPGGGGLGGASAGTTPRAPGGASPNSPIDTAIPAQGGGEPAVERDARVQAADEAAPEPRPSSH